MRAQQETYIAPSIDDINDSIKQSLKTPTSFPNLAGNYSTQLFAYDDSGKTVQMLGIDISNGFSSILALGLGPSTTLQFTDNTLRSYRGVLSDIDNFNVWIRDAKKDAEENNNGAVTTDDSTTQSPTVLYTADTRIPGTVSLVGNYELLSAAPLDARTLTYTKETLVDPAWWITAFKRPVYLYRGLIVSVKSTSELYMYIGIDICVKSNDVTTKREIAIDKWKRISFHQDDLANNSLLILNHIEANKRSGIRTSDTTSWKSDNTLFLSAEKSLNDVGATLATDYILLGSHYHYKSDYSVHREIYNIYKDSDNFMGLTIIPPEPYKHWDKKLYRNKSTGIELLSILSPLLLKYKYIDDPAVTPYTIGVTLAKDGINLSAPERNVSINAKNLDLSRIENISYGTFTLNVNTLKMNVKNSVLGTGSMLTMLLSGGSYLSSGDETNIIAGAFAIHTTGYTINSADSNNSILLNPVSFDLRKGTQGSQGYSVDIQTQGKVNTVNPNKQKANNAKSATTEYPADMNSRSAGDFTTTAAKARKTGANGGSPINNIVAPTTTANFNKIHNENLRLTPELVTAFKNAVDNNEITLIDLSDKQGLINSKKIVYATDLEFKSKLEDLLRTQDITESDAKNVELKILNTENEVWVNNTTYTTGTGLTGTLNKGYTMIGNNNVINQKIATNLTELINNGTISVESFGDVSIQSHFGQVKLGPDGFVRTTRFKYFVVENDENSYLRATPYGIELNYTRSNYVDTSTIGPGGAEVNSANNRGYIKLNAGSILLWDGYELLKPVGNNLVLTYSDEGTSTKSLQWKTSETISGSLNPTNNLYSARTASLQQRNGMDIVGNTTQTKDEWLESTTKTRYNTTQCNLYKIGHLEYPLFSIPGNSNALVTESNVIQFNTVLQLTLASPLYSGNIIVDLQIYNNGKAKIILNDLLIKYYDKLALKDDNNSLKYFTAPIIFNHILPTDKSPFGNIEFYVLSNNYSDCHWIILTIKDTNEEIKWVNVKSDKTPVIPSGSDKIKNILNNISYDSTTIFKNLEPSNSSCNILLGYVRPLLLSSEIGNQSEPWSNTILDLPSNTGTYYLQYSPEENSFTWEPDRIMNTELGITLQTINKSSSKISSAKDKIYLVGVYDSIKKEDITSWKLNNSTTFFHDSIYYDKSGDIHASNFYSISDKRLKDEIQPLTLKENYLPPLKLFKLKTNNELNYGFIALEIEEAGYPELIHTDENGYKRVNYISAYAVLFKELQLEISQLKAEIQLLKSKNNYH